MKTTKEIIKSRLLRNDNTLTEESAQQFVDDLFPNVEMNIIVETDDNDEDEATGNVGDLYI